MSGGRPPELWVVVPALNEARSLPATLAALAAQHDADFALVVVDNGSVDDTRALARAFADQAPFEVRVISEDTPGAGAAADAGFRYAIEQGARWLARTDADCLPARNWTAVARAELRSGAELVCGRSVPRWDESPSLAETTVLPAVVRLTALYGRYRRAHRHPRYLAPYVLCHGHNLAITADLYLRCGGTPRVSLRERDEDVELLNRARQHSSRIVRAEHLVVYNSLRRLRAWGARRTLLWYWDRRYRPATENEVHVR